MPFPFSVTGSFAPEIVICKRRKRIEYFNSPKAHSFLFDNWAFWPNEMKSPHSELNQQPWKVMATPNGQLRSSGIGVCFKGGLDRRYNCSRLGHGRGSAPISSRVFRTSLEDDKCSTRSYWDCSK
ncbi:hypothetical protein NPIL_72231 [Nephila pilipes]|uniref:Uncharacterized protein n=1 Tax=Nephila pilipes TaxID=299642 RepID=A0A8X6NHJ8_NEPPI|nr:hypothetical protein NPIL_72231 [Nephila pilipes]